MITKRDGKPTRIPRMQGLTYLSLNHQRDKSDFSKEELYKYIVTQYTLQGFRINKVSLSVTELAHYIRIPQTQVMNYIASVSTNLGSLNDPLATTDLMKSIITLSTTWAIQDKGLIMNQIDTLSRAQGGQYRAFISSELNKALKLSLESNKNLMEAYKAFFTSSQSSTQILQILQPKQEKTNNLLTTDEAVKLIHNTNKELTNNSNINNNTTSNSSFSENQTLADDLFKEYGLAKISDLNFGDSVSEPDSLKANVHNESSPKALKPKGSTSHTDFNDRRGIDIVENDDFPNRE